LEPQLAAIPRKDDNAAAKDATTEADGIFATTAHVVALHLA